MVNLESANLKRNKRDALGFPIVTVHEVGQHRPPSWCHVERTSSDETKLDFPLADKLSSLVQGCRGG